MLINNQVATKITGLSELKKYALKYITKHETALRFN